MSKFKIGDKVVATKGLGEYFKTGTKGVGVKVNRAWCLVAFTEGDYKKDKGFLNKNGQWWGHSNNMELVKETNTKSGDGYATTLQAVGEGRKIMQKQSGDGYAIKAWAVEVDGEISPWCTYPSRKEAREERNWHADNGAKAHVRKVEIRKVKGKV